MIPGDIADVQACTMSAQLPDPRPRPTGLKTKGPDTPSQGAAEPGDRGSTSGFSCSQYSLIAIHSPWLYMTDTRHNTSIRTGSHVTLHKVHPSPCATDAQTGLAELSGGEASTPRCPCALCSSPSTHRTKAMHPASSLLSTP